MTSFSEMMPCCLPAAGLFNLSTVTDRKSCQAQVSSRQGFSHSCWQAMACSGAQQRIRRINRSKPLRRQRETRLEPLHLCDGGCDTSTMCGQGRAAVLRTPCPFLTVYSTEALVCFGNRALSPAGCCEVQDAQLTSGWANPTLLPWMCITRGRNRTAGVTEVPNHGGHRSEVSGVITSIKFQACLGGSSRTNTGLTLVVPTLLSPFDTAHHPLYRWMYYQIRPPDVSSCTPLPKLYMASDFMAYCQSQWICWSRRCYYPGRETRALAREVG
jgi:hypothetical protein